MEVYPKIWIAKHYDYKAKKVENHFEIYRREMEGEPWILYGRCVIVDGILFANWVGMYAKDETADYSYKSWQNRTNRKDKDEQT